MEKIIVSKCLLGYPCRYDGKSVPCKEVIDLQDRYELIPVCPEQLGGLPTPRTPSERIGDKVIMKDGTDVTRQYNRGAEETLRLAKLFDIRTAILKSKSPSCGKGLIHDGTFEGGMTEGHGVPADLLMRTGIKVYTEEELDLLP